MLHTEGKEWFRAIFEQIAAGMVITDTAGRFLRANPTFCQFLGYTEDELLKLRLLDVTHPDDQAQVQRNFNEVMAGVRQAIDLEKRCLRKDGTIVWGHATAVCLHDEHANPIYCVAVMQDITESKRAEEALRESEAHFRAIAESAFNAFVSADSAGRIISWNRAAQRMFQYTEEEVLGQTLTMIMPERYRQACQEGIERYQHTGIARYIGQTTELHGQRKDGSEFPVEVSLASWETERGAFYHAIIRDITERKTLEQELVLRERSLNSFFTAAPAGLAILDAELRFLQINDTLAQMHGLAAPAHRGKTVSEILPQMAPVIEPIARRVLDTGEPALNFETSGETPAQPGILRHWAASYFPILGTDGKPHSIGVVVVELTERRRAEEALRASEERYRRFFERNLAGVFRSTLDGTMLDCNESFARILGYASRKEALTHRATDFYFQPADREAAISRLKEQYILASQEVCVPRKDGSPVWVVGTASLFEGEAGRPAVIEGTFIDITERKRAEERFRLAVESAPNGMVMVNEEGRIILVNSETERLFGYRREELLGQSVEQLVPERFRHTHPAHRASFAATPEARPMGVGHDLYGLRKDGSEFPVEIGLNPIETERGLWVLSSVVDITERKRTEAALRESAERLQTLSRRLLEVQETERRSIARELHDEIGQALTAVKINLQGIPRLTEPSAQAPYLEDSASLVERALQQVRNLSLDLRPSLLDDLGLVPALRWYLDRQAQRAGFAAQLVADPLEMRLPAHIETVCFRVAQEALTNVVRHAQAERVQVELRRSAAELQLIVRDAGVGFDARAARERAARGASLGLLGMEERVRLAGGQIEIESKPGHGTQIRARFPV